MAKAQYEETRPPWLLRQENGTLAEARTRAFLLDRFWVLERSVDFEGADLIVQRRLTHRSLLERDPPRLGFIQAKFYSTQSTTQYVHREYIVDAEGKARNEFFVICHTGNEDGARLFLLSATEISNNFSVTDEHHSMPNRFALPGNEVLIQRYEILDRGRALSTIEVALKNADFRRNRAFLSWAIPVRPEPGPIDQLYHEPINNWWGDIPAGFEHLRSQARKGKWNLEEVLEKLRVIEESSDPEKALSVAEEIKFEWGNRVHIPDDLWNEDFMNAVQYHKQRYEELTGAGLMSAFAAFRRVAIQMMVDQLAPLMPFPSDRVFVITARYHSDTLLNPHFDTRTESCSAVWPTPDPDRGRFYKDIPNTEGILSSRPGLVEAYLVAGRYGYDKMFKNGKWVDSDGPWSERIRGVVESFIGILLDRVLVLRFGE